MSGYILSPHVAQAIAALENQTSTGARALLVTGAPGTGKTALAEYLAQTQKSRYIYALLHSWSGSDDLFSGINVQAAVAGDSSRVAEPGVLALVAQASQTDPVVVCLDELDKAPESVEGLLLDWLQSGRVPIRPGVHLETRLDQVTIVITSNGTRPHTDALLRRCRRLRMKPLDADVRVKLAAERSGAPLGICRMMDKAMQMVAKVEGNEALSLQEIVHACREVWTIAQSPAMVAEALAAWAARTDEGALAVQTPEVARMANAIWGEVCAHRRQQEKIIIKAS